MRLKKAYWQVLSVSLTVGALLVLTLGTAIAGGWD